MTGRVAFPALGIAFLLIAGQAMRTRLSPDEWQHLTTVADIVRGTNEYVDSWDNHTHAFHAIVASFLEIERVQPHEVMAVRIGLAACSIGVALSLMLLLSFAGVGSSAARGSGVFAAFSPSVLLAGFEIRPDVLLAWAWVLSLAMLLSPSLSSRHHARAPGVLRHLLAGVVVGVGFMFSVKAVICMAGYVAGVVLAVASTRWTVREGVRGVAFACAGFALSVIAWLAAGIPAAARVAFIDQVLLGNFGSSERFPPSLTTYQIAYWVLGLIGIVTTIRSIRQLRAPEIFLVGATLGPTAAYLFIMPAPYPQMLLTLTPLWSFYIWKGWMFLRACSRRPQLVGVALLALYALPPAVKCVRRFQELGEQRDQFRRIAVVESLTSPSETVFDGYGMFYSRPHPYFVGSFVKAIKYQIKAGKMSVSDIVHALHARATPVVVRDVRVAGLGSPLREYLDAHYAPLLRTSEILIRREELELRTRSLPLSH
jgi:hypothetical protein